MGNWQTNVVANDYGGGAGVWVLEGGGNSAVEVHPEEDGDFAEVAEEAGAALE
jgi:hypothetical protein